VSVYYNEHDPKMAAWLRELIKVGVIADGAVDERSIVAVEPGDLAGFTQHHFFAGIGVWSYALRLAGWADDDAVWTGSCPCQSFSASGTRQGFSDPRHLWPAWFRLIRECRPDLCFGEQVASQDGLAWVDVVSADLEGAGYAVGTVDFPACGVGAPHIRQRLFFVGESDGAGSFKRREAAETVGHRNSAVATSRVDFVADTKDTDRRGGKCATEEGTGPVQFRGGRFASGGTPGPVNGFWADAEWLHCADGKARPIESGSSPLVTRASARVVRLRGYGNAINAEAAKAFIEAFQDVRAER